MQGEIKLLWRAPPPQFLFLFSSVPVILTNRFGFPDIAARKTAKWLCKYRLWIGDEHMLTAASLTSCSFLKFFLLLFSFLQSTERQTSPTGMYYIHSIPTIEQSQTHTHRWFSNFDEVEVGEPFTVTWIGNKAAVSISLMYGDPTRLSLHGKIVGK